MDLPTENPLADLERPDLDHPAWTAGVATAASYLLALLAMFVLLFAIPYLLFLLL